MIGDPLDSIVGRLREEAIAFALIGAAARNAWAPPRLSTDIDFAVVAGPIEHTRLDVLMREAGYHAVLSQRAQPGDAVPAVTVYRNPDAAVPFRQIDILFAATQFEREAVARAVAVRIGAIDVPVVTREDLIVYKLIAWRPRDRQDIADLLASAESAGVALDLEHIRGWAAIWEVEERLARALAGLS